LLLLLLGKLGVSRLALHSAKLVGLWALTTAASGTFLLEREHGGLDDSFWLQVLNLIGGHLAENLSYDLHSRRELAEDDHCLHGAGKSKPVSLRYVKWLSILVIAGAGWEPVGIVVKRSLLSSA